MTRANKRDLYKAILDGREYELRRKMKQKLEYTSMETIFSKFQ